MFLEYVCRWLYLWMVIIILIAISLCPAADVALSWQPPENTNHVAGYRVHVGLVSRQYDRVIDAGLATNCVVSNIGTNDNTYYGFTSYNKYGRDSAFCKDELIWDVEGFMVVTQPPRQPSFLEKLVDWFKRWFRI